MHIPCTGLKKLLHDKAKYFTAAVIDVCFQLVDVICTIRAFRNTGLNFGSSFPIKNFSSFICRTFISCRNSHRFFRFMGFFRVNQHCTQDSRALIRPLASSDTCFLNCSNGSEFTNRRANLSTTCSNF